MVLNSRSRVGNKVKLPPTTDHWLKNHFFIVCDKDIPLNCIKKASGATMFFALLPIDHMGEYDYISPRFSQYVVDNNGKYYGTLTTHSDLTNYVYDYFMKKGGK